jgi:HSP20 family molecular chaperone IbpA
MRPIESCSLAAWMAWRKYLTTIRAAPVELYDIVEDSAWSRLCKGARGGETTDAGGPARQGGCVVPTIAGRRFHGCPRFVPRRIIPVESTRSRGGEMEIVKWTPLRELEAMERRMRRVFDEAGFATALLPAAAVYATDEEYVVELEVPGFEEMELTIEVTDHTVCVKGERTEEKEKKDKTYRLHERLEKSFERPSSSRPRMTRRPSKPTSKRASSRCTRRRLRLPRRA